MDGATGRRGATTFGEPMAEKRMNVQNSVLRAVCRGYRYSGDIAAAAGIRKVEVFAHLRRLMAKGLVECYRCTHSASRKAYSITSIKVVLLEKLWTKTEATCHAIGKKIINCNSNEAMTKGRSKGNVPVECMTKKTSTDQAKTSTTKSRSAKVVSRKAATFA